MSETIFVGHQPGTYKVYKTIGGWALMFLDQQGNSRNVDGDKVYPSRQNAYRRCRQLNRGILLKVLENYVRSDDFKEGVIASTRASWSGSGYSVELHYDGEWRNLWNNQIGNKYESEGAILRLPTVDTDDMGEYVDSGAGSEDDYLSEAFCNEEQELAQKLRDNLVE